jgi:dethiobiotin synthetase
MEGLFFTGTDTGVGKTIVAAAVARSLRRQGHDVRVCKPVATGARQTDGVWLSEDTEILARAAGMENEIEQVTPYSFPDPVAPPVAARRQGAQLSLAALAAAVRRCHRPGRPVLVEGVGGLLCPLTDQETVADLAAELGLPLVVVARLSLGTLNHTLLTLEAARCRRLAVAGVVLNACRPPQGLADDTNPEELRKRIIVPLLALVPYVTGCGATALPDIAEVEWRELCLRGR